MLSPLSRVLLSLLTLPLAFLANGAFAATPNVLIFTATTGFRHDSIPVAVEALQQQAERANVNWTHTEDSSHFNDGALEAYDGVVFLSASGEVFNDQQKAAFQSWLNKGGNFVGIHSATDCLLKTDFYRREIGAYFDYHPDIQEASVNVIDPGHPSTDHLPRPWIVRDEWYNFKSDPRDVGAVVILSADENSYEDNGPRNPAQGTPHPTAWFQERGAGVEEGQTAGRSFYTSLGHLNETWQDETFMTHVLGGLSWALQSNTTRAFNASGVVGAIGDPSDTTASGDSTSQTESETETSLTEVANPSSDTTTTDDGAESSAAHSTVSAAVGLFTILNALHLVHREL
ncbi:trehalose utilization-domain-containing protein [Pterulicium gracile]|uniref:Trehalose utilization-domain-containing protein n=1 Tax=Pterulicium gracile TaxID=1884261 RepID=A0A5C3Q9F6_9AGAR|nr:trehalose utilization-domain-containing protein [Pterula gracilis]